MDRGGRVVSRYSTLHAILLAALLAALAGCRSADDVPDDLAPPEADRLEAESEEP